MTTPRPILRQALRAITVISGVGVVAVLALCGASWAAGGAGCHLKLGDHFQIIERDSRLWFFSDDSADAKSHPAPFFVGNAPGIPVGHRFDAAILGFEGHYCELPSASRTIWSHCVPTRAAFVILLVIGVASHFARNRLPSAPATGDLLRSKSQISTPASLACRRAERRRELRPVNGR